MTRNRLAEETSPYLLQHKDNPVHWQAWGPEALAEARRDDKPILLSVGYAACHWCHVMAHESFENAEIAAADEQPVRQHQGRPRGAARSRRHLPGGALAPGPAGRLAADHVPDARGEPFWGGTYFPPEDRWGRPGFRQVLTHHRRDLSPAIRRGSKRMSRPSRQRLPHLAKPRAGSPVAPEAARAHRASACCRKSISRMAASAERRNFRNVPIFELLWRARHAQRRQALPRGRALDARSHVPGRHLRSSRRRLRALRHRRRWLVPHFEKMLYDNAPAARAPDARLAGDRANRSTRSASRETVGLAAARDARAAADGAALPAALDADSEGEEGKFYVWTEAEIDAAAGRRRGPVQADSTT